MKRLAFATGLFAAFACSSLDAQSIDVKANIPFPFQVGEKAMPAGTYQVRNSQDMLVVRDERGRHVAVEWFTIAATRNNPPGKGELVFNRYGSAYFLSRIWVPATTDGRALRRTRHETELARRSGEPVQIAAVPLASQ